MFQFVKLGTNIKIKEYETKKFNVCNNDCMRVRFLFE